MLAGLIWYYQTQSVDMQPQVTHELTIPIYQAGIARFEYELRAIAKLQQKSMSDRKRQLYLEKNIAIFTQKVERITNHPDQA